MILFQISEAWYNCGKLGNRANEFSARKNIGQNQRKTKDFKESVVPVDRADMLTEIFGPGKKTRIKGRKIGGSQAKKRPLLLLNPRKMTRLLSMIGLLKIWKQH
jgi:hypothetical protein